MLKGLYVITDEKLTPYDKILYMVEKALIGGVKIVQLRDKNNKDEDIQDYAEQLKNLCKKYNAIFIINDRIELAKEVDADGVHVGEEYDDIKDLRKYLPDKIIGVSCYGSIERAKKMEEDEADYVAFGSFFPSPTKPKPDLVPKEIIKEAKKTLKIPICAIGGITVENAKELINLGADMIAVVSDIWKQEDIAKRALEYKKLFED